MSYISVDIDIDDIISGMSKYDRRIFFKAMQEDGCISESCIITDDGTVEAPARIERNAKAESVDDFNRALQKLYGNGWKLTREEEDYIINLSKRF